MYHSNQQIYFTVHALQVEIAAVLVNQHKVSPTSLLALTPYSSQKEEIKNRLKAKKMSEIAVKTITESQGEMRASNYRLPPPPQAPQEAGLQTGNISDTHACMSTILSGLDN